MFGKYIESSKLNEKQKDYFLMTSQNTSLHVLFPQKR